MKAVWDQYTCEIGVTYAFEMAQLRLWLQRTSQGWQTAFRHEAQEGFTPLHTCGAIPPDLEWQRFITPPDAVAVRLVPVLPDRSVMSRPEGRIEIAPRHRGLFLVTIPVWVRVQTEVPSPVSLGDYPTVLLSKTWFGHPSEDGEIGYALTTRARQEMAELTDIEGRAICPVSIENHTDDALTFAQLLLSVRHMSVYQTADGKLWTNECSLGYTGSVFPASVTFGREAPKQARGAKLLSGPRVVPSGRLMARVITNTIFKQPF
jgi:hypothetical protein